MLTPAVFVIGDLLKFLANHAELYTQAEIHKLKIDGDWNRYNPLLFMTQLSLLLQARSQPSSSL